MKKVFMFLTLICTILSTYNVNATEIEHDIVNLSTCVDGNSARFMLNNKEIKVKFIATESVPTIMSEYNDEINGSLVNDYVCSILTNAKEIKIEYEPNSEKEDKYGRILAWVYVDDVLLQEHLVELGYAKVAFIYDDYLYNDVLLNAEAKAKEENKGVWKEINEEQEIEPNIPKVEEPKEEENVFKVIMNFINDIFEKLLKLIDDLINDVL
ncbi:MAG: thermonuclease family protein [Bacilli bacterium]|nr:thermonuclease family protein [Bacilli bacterium]